MKKQVALSPATQHFKTLLEAKGLPPRIMEFPAGSTHTAEQTAAAIGCPLGQVAKSIVFRTTRSREAVLVLASGANRVDRKWIVQKIRQDIDTASPDFVKAKTGYAVGSVSPLGFKQRIPYIFIDRDLLTFEEIWAAAGTDSSVFALDPKSLSILLPEAQVIEIHDSARKEISTRSTPLPGRARLRLI